MLEICLWVFTSGSGIVDIPEKATECLQLFLLSSSYFFASAFHGLCFVHVGISPTILRTSQWVAFIGWSPSLIRWIKYGQFAVVVFLYIYISLSSGYSSRLTVLIFLPCMLSGLVWINIASNGLIGSQASKIGDWREPLNRSVCVLCEQVAEAAFESPEAGDGVAVLVLSNPCCKQTTEPSRVWGPMSGPISGHFTAGRETMV